MLTFPTCRTYGISRQFSRLKKADQQVLSQAGPPRPAMRLLTCAPGVQYCDRYSLEWRTVNLRNWLSQGASTRSSSGTATRTLRKLLQF